jgi:LacI family repressor for deo operon, udp, cdd, tsx, nupC, and nupG
MIPDISSPFYSRVLQSIEDAAQREGYSVLLADTQHDRKREERYTLMLRRRDAEGLIVLGCGLPEAAVEVSRETAASPTSSAAAVDSRVRVPRVHIDNRAAARDVIEHLYCSAIAGSASLPGRVRSTLSRDRLAGATARARIQEAARDHRDCGDFSMNLAKRLRSS